ncbi:MAG: hypothetical protein IJ127_09705, partial [Afipia sp.]|nr:hypothetical protein [Afipia sp.]
MIVHVVDPEFDPVRIARANGVISQPKAQPIAVAEIGGGLRDRTALAGLAVEQLFVREALQHDCELPG